MMSGNQFHHWSSKAWCTIRIGVEKRLLTPRIAEQKARKGYSDRISDPLKILVLLNRHDATMLGNELSSRETQSGCWSFLWDTRCPSLKKLRFSVILMHSLHIIDYTYSPSIGHNFRPKYVCFKLLLMLRWIRIYQLMRFPSGSQQKLCTRELQAWAMNRLKYDWAGWLQVEMVHEDVVRTHKPGTSFGQSLGGTHP